MFVYCVVCVVRYCLCCRKRAGSNVLSILTPSWFSKPEPQEQVVVARCAHCGAPTAQQAPSAAPGGSTDELHTPLLPATATAFLAPPPVDPDLLTPYTPTPRWTFTPNKTNQLLNEMADMLAAVATPIQTLDALQQGTSCKSPQCLASQRRASSAEGLANQREASKIDGSADLRRASSPGDLANTRASTINCEIDNRTMNQPMNTEKTKLSKEEAKSHGNGLSNGKATGKSHRNGTTNGKEDIASHGNGLSNGKTVQVNGSQNVLKPNNGHAYNTSHAMNGDNGCTKMSTNHRRDAPNAQVYSTKTERQSKTIINGFDGMGPDQNGVDKTGESMLNGTDIPLENGTGCIRVIPPTPKLVLSKEMENIPDGIDILVTSPSPQVDRQNGGNVASSPKVPEIGPPRLSSIENPPIRTRRVRRKVPSAKKNASPTPSTPASSPGYRSPIQKLLTPVSVPWNLLSKVTSYLNRATLHGEEEKSAGSPGGNTPNAKVEDGLASAFGSIAAPLMSTR